MAELKPFDVNWLSKRGNFYALITPDVAAELIGRNENNRSKKLLKVDQYAKDMRAGKWHPDASDIKFDVNGKLLDGQNRLLACIQADVPFPTLVRTGLDAEAQPHMDTGATRTIGDVFKMHKVPDFNNVAAAVSLRSRYESLVASGDSILERRLPLTRQESLDYLAEHPMIEKVIPLAYATYPVAPGIQRSVWLAGYSTFAEIDEPAARHMAAQFIAGDMEQQQLLALMRYAMRTQTPKQQERAVKLKNAGLRHLFAMVVTWNAIRAGEPLSRINVRDDEPAVAAK